MRFHCSVCQELFNSSDVVVTPQCGHTFHNDCIVQWLGSAKKSCPTCRQSTSLDKLVRLYFDVAPQIEEDSADLQQKLDDSALKLMQSEKVVRELREETQTLKKKANKYSREKKEADGRLRESQSVVDTLQKRVEFLSTQSKNLNVVEEQLRVCGERLKLMEDVQKIVNATHDEVEEMLHQYGDHSETAKSLSTQCVILSRELNSKAAAKRKSDEELHKCRRQLTSVTLQVQTLAKQLKEKEEQCTLAEEEVARYVSDNSKLQDKIRALQESISSPSGDPRGSALSRLLMESPAPLGIKCGNFQDSPSSPLLHRKFRPQVDAPVRSKLASEPKLTDPSTMVPRLSNPEEIPVAKRSVDIDADTVKLVQSKRSRLDPTPSSSGYFYDGLGGHSKPDIYPSGRQSSQEAKKGRTIKMKIKGKVSTQTLDHFFAT